MLLTSALILANLFSADIYCPNWNAPETKQNRSAVKNTKAEKKRVTEVNPNQNDELSWVIIHNEAQRDDRSVKINLLSTEIQYLERGKVPGSASILSYPALSLPIEITNNSNYPICTNLKHEWLGGIIIPSQLFITSKNEYRSSKTKEYWSNYPGFQIGKRSDGGDVIFQPHEKKIIDVRLNFRANTESYEPFVDVDAPKEEYKFKFLLFYKIRSQKKYLLTRELMINFKKRAGQ